MRLRPAGHTAACLAVHAHNVVAGAFIDHQAEHTAACLAGAPTAGRPAAGPAEFRPRRTARPLPSPTGRRR